MESMKWTILIATFLIFLQYEMTTSSPIHCSFERIQNGIRNNSDTLDSYPPWDDSPLISYVKFILNRDVRLPENLHASHIPIMALDIRVLAWCYFRTSYMANRSGEETLFPDSILYYQALVWVKYTDSIRQKPWWVILHISMNKDSKEWNLIDYRINMNVPERMPLLPIVGYDHAPTNSDIKMLIDRDSSQWNIQHIERLTGATSGNHTTIFVDGAIRRNTWRTLIGDNPWWRYSNGK